MRYPLKVVLVIFTAVLMPILHNLTSSPMEILDKVGQPSKKLIDCSIDELTKQGCPPSTNFFGFPQMIASENKQSVRLTQTSKVSVNGIGPVKIGMTIEEASRVAGVKLRQRSSGGEPSCLYYKPQTGLSGVDFMVTDGRISRIDITNPQITTLSGAKVGDSENQIKSLYAGQIQVEPHKYEPLGHYLIFVPQDRQDQSYRVLFETDGKKVTRYRAGKLPEVGWVEGCA